MFSTVFIFIIDFKKSMLTYINCGNEPALLYGNEGGITELWPTGPIVGIIPNAEFLAKEIVIKDNDLLLAYTDGVTDALNTNEASFSRARLTGLLKEGQTTCDELVKTIEQRLNQFIGEAVQFDDITALAVKKQTSGQVL